MKFACFVGLKAVNIPWKRSIAVFNLVMGRIKLFIKRAAFKSSVRLCFKPFKGGSLKYGVLNVCFEALL